MRRREAGRVTAAGKQMFACREHIGSLQMVIGTTRKEKELPGWLAWEEDDLSSK